MSDNLEQQEDTRSGKGVSDEDIRALLEQERAEKTQLRTQLEQERTHRNRAEATASNAVTARFDAEEAAVNARVSAAKDQAVALKKQLSSAMAEGDFDAAAEIHEKISENIAAMGADNQYKVFLASEKQRLQRQEKQERERPAATSLDLSQFSSRQRAWIKDNPGFMEDEAMRRKTILGHELAVSNGVAVDSDEYFEVINQAVYHGKKPPKQAAAGQSNGHEGDDDPPPRRQSREATDMPVQRRPVLDNEGQQRRQQQSVRLTEDEREAADITIGLDVPVQGWTDQKTGNWVPGRYERYAVQRQLAKASGRI